MVRGRPPASACACVRLGRKTSWPLNLETMTGLEGWQPGKKLLQIIADLQRAGRL
jgi:hypothetical protein